MGRKGEGRVPGGNDIDEGKSFSTLEAKNQQENENIFLDPYLARDTLGHESIEGIGKTTQKILLVTIV